MNVPLLDTDITKLRLACIPKDYLDTWDDLPEHHKTAIILARFHELELEIDALKATINRVEEVVYTKLEE
jgi:hypothetical protein